MARLGMMTGALALGAGMPVRPAAAATRRRFYEFTFARLRYNSGDWDYNPKVCSNLLDAVVQYTDIPVNQQEIVITADSAELTEVVSPVHDRG